MFAMVTPEKTQYMRYFPLTEIQNIREKNQKRTKRHNWFPNSQHNMCTKKDKKGKKIRTKHAYHGV